MFRVDEDEPGVSGQAGSKTPGEATVVDGFDGGPFEGSGRAIDGFDDLDPLGEVVDVELFDGTVGAPLP